LTEIVFWGYPEVLNAANNSTVYLEYVQQISKGVFMKKERVVLSDETGRILSCASRRVIIKRGENGHIRHVLLSPH
jgi:hypothetical protein